MNKRGLLATAGLLTLSFVFCSPARAQTNGCNAGGVEVMLPAIVSPRQQKVRVSSGTRIFVRQSFDVHYVGDDKVAYDKTILGPIVITYQNAGLTVTSQNSRKTIVAPTTASIDYDPGLLCVSPSDPAPSGWGAPVYVIP